MSQSQKVLKIFGLLEIVLAIISAVGAVRGGGAASWGSAAFSVLTAVILLSAAKDASKIGAAWLITFVNLVLSVLELILALNNSAPDKKTLIIGAGIAIVLNLIVFIAANNVKKQNKT